MKSLIQKSKKMVSREGAQELYEQRREAMRDTGERTLWTSVIAITLACTALTMLLVSSWNPTDRSEYLKKQPSLFSIDPMEVTWYSSDLVDSPCGLDISCFDLKKTLSLSSLEVIDQTINDSGVKKYLLLNMSIRKGQFSALAFDPTFVVKWPSFRYERAKTFYEGELVRTFHRGETVTVTMPQKVLDEHSHYSISLLMEVLPSDKGITGERANEGIIVGSQNEYQAYRNYLVLESNTARGPMGTIAKIVLALFCLLLFLIVDSSPESLGLALFMGFEALAMGIGRNWIPLGLLGIENDLVWTNCCYQMGDLLKIYFFLQLARLGKPNIWPWLIVGIAVSVPYGFFMQYAYENSFTWQYKIPRTRDTIAGGIGFLVCIHALYLLRGQKLPWRKAALTLGIAAAFIEVSKSWVAHSQIIGIYPILRTAYGMMEANLGYIFALSTFLNISTLENRVRTLTLEKEKANEIKRQMELGQSLQKAFLTLPKLPESVQLSCYHEAAVYVSGDTYFVHWDQGRDTITFLLNDVTGVGVQAALKAFAGNVIARTIWVDSARDIRRRGDRRRQITNLEKYDTLVDQLLCQNANEATDDFNAMIGAEFDVKTGDLTLYRANYNFPFVVQPEFDWFDHEESEFQNWKFEKVALKNREAMEVKLKPGSFVIFVSDGYIESSRDERSFSRAIQQMVANSKDILDSGMIQAHALSWASDHGKDSHSDDRTVMVFQWLPKADEMKKSGDNPMTKTA